jgi:hypothetical protein
LITALSVSASSGKGKWFTSLNSFCFSTGSVLTPMTATPLALRSAVASRREQPCLVQPPVRAFG